MNMKKHVRMCLAVAALGLALGLAPIAGAGAGAATPTCSQLSKAEIQPLLIHHVTKLTVKPVPGILYLSSAKSVGETCVFADTETSSALSVTVVGGSAATRAYQSETHSLGDLAQVPSVSGGKGIRQRADRSGAVTTAEVASINGSTYCAVVPEEGELPGVAALEQAAGSTADIGDKAYADIAAAIGTVCNRIYGGGSTNPASALAALKQIKPHHGGGGITVPTPPKLP